MKYVIERMNKETREWWTGTEWSDVDTDAEWYEDEEDAVFSAMHCNGEVVGYETGSEVGRWTVETI